VYHDRGAIDSHDDPLGSLPKKALFNANTASGQTHVVTARKASIQDKAVQQDIHKQKSGRQQQFYISRESEEEHKEEQRKNGDCKPYIKHFLQGSRE
jgi:hypothetical protein